MAPSTELSEEVRSFFTLRQSWAWTHPNGWFGDGRDKWPWLDHCPQTPGWHKDPQHPEQVSVCVAQHPTTNIGRSFHNGRQPPPEERHPEQGLCFAEQWESALKIDPEFIFVTGWNEWVAMRFESDGRQSLGGEPVPKGGSYFVDQYNQEYSRDIEPMTGGHGDNYYYQLVAGIRRFKGVRPLPAVSPPKRIHIDGRFAEWTDVQPVYRDHFHDTVPRDHPGWGREGQYVNYTGRNDILVAKVARDAEWVYFYALTAAPITHYTDRHWMMLFLKVGGEVNWEGYVLS
ncbi:MAG: hypothetical protein ACUVX8_09435 [Candidatus Zipacnadales bacterium]